MSDSTSTPSASTVRAWARAEGYNIGSRGKISAEVVTAYHAAHQPVVTN
jgi:hypothetical protein